MLESRPNRRLQPAKPDNRHFRDYPLTGHAADMRKSTRMTQSRRWMFGRILGLGLDGRESYRELRWSRYAALTV
jgi:hypothetical protein